MRVTSLLRSSFITVADLSQYSSSPGVPVLHGPPPKVPNQNTPQEKWEAARGMWKAYEKLVWFLNQDLEPNMPNEKKSILSQWLNEVEGETAWKCVVPLDDEATWCRHPHLRRLDRALAHVRSHLGLKPFPCEGRCERNDDWYAPMRYSYSKY